MRQAGILAAAGIIAIEERRHRLHVDHENAATLAEGLIGCGFKIVNGKPDINMVFADTGMDEEQMGEYLRYLRQNGVLAGSVSIGVVRFVTNREVTAEDVEFVVWLTKSFVEQ